jgi:hypothetical protein
MAMNLKFNKYLGSNIWRPHSGLKIVGGGGCRGGLISGFGDDITRSMVLLMTTYCRLLFDGLRVELRRVVVASALTMLATVSYLRFAASAKG